MVADLLENHTCLYRHKQCSKLLTHLKVWLQQTITCDPCPFWLCYATMLDATFSLCSNFLKAHTPGFLNTPPSGQPPSLATADARMIHGKTFAEIMAEPNSALRTSRGRSPCWKISTLIGDLLFDLSMCIGIASQPLLLVLRA